MQRLKKIAIIGDIKSSDIDLVVNNSKIEAVLKNTDKALHDTTQNPSFKWEDAGQNVIGYMQWSEQTQGNKIVFYVEYLEVLEEYTQTMVAMMIMKKFKSDILEPAITQFGKDNVLLASEVVNQKLKETLNRVIKKLGVQWIDDAQEIPQDSNRGMGENDLSELANSLQQAGINVDDELMTINASINQYIDIVSKNTNKNNVEVFGYADGNGDIHFTYLGTSSLDFKDYGLEFSAIEGKAAVDALGPEMEGWDKTIKRFQKRVVNTQNFINNAEIVFEGCTIQYGDSSSSTVDELAQHLLQPQEAKNEPAIASINRLKKTIFN